MSTVNITSVLSFVQDKTFDELKRDSGEKYVVKEKKDSDQSDLYLIASTSGEDDFYYQCNGLIFEKNTNKLVCAAQNRFHDVNQEELQEVVKSKLDSNRAVVVSTPNQARVEYCEDGTVVRLYYHGERWYTATARCMNAADSFWASSKTFDEMFWEVFDEQHLKTLDKTFTYVFVLVHSDNRIVVRHKNNGLVYISRINNQTLKEDYMNIFQGMVWRPRYVPHFELDAMNDYYLPFKRGILVKLFDNITESWNVYKIDFEQFTAMKAIRGNVPDIKFRYLELMQDTESAITLQKYYSEYKHEFKMARDAMFKLVKEIHKLYVDSHIKHVVSVTDENEHHRTLKQLHAQYKNTNKPITYQDVQNRLCSLHQTTLRKMLKL